MNKIKIIQNRDFYKFWKAACEINNEQEYINALRNFSFKKYNLKYDEFIFTLKEIHKQAQKTFKDIINENKMTNAQVSNAFCIPIRTVEAWSSGINKCPEYIKLMLLRYFHMFNFGHYIRIESVDKYNKTIPYKSRIKKEEKTVNKRNVHYSFDDYDHLSESILSKTDYLNDIINRKR